MVRSVERCVDILDCLAPPGRALSLSQISRALKAPKSTVLTILRTLVAHGFLAFNPEAKTYRLGLALTRFAAHDPPTVDLSTLAKPHLERLVQKSQETAFLAIREGHSVFYTCRIDSPQLVQYLAQVGVRRPLHCTASGKIGLASMGEAEVRAYVRQTGLRRYTPSTITQAARLFRELRSIRRRGYAINRGEFFPDLFGIAAPVRDATGAVIASANLGGPLFRLQGRAAAFAREVVATAAAISADIRRLGGKVRVSE